MSDEARPAARQLPWDSEFFGYPVAAIALSSANDAHNLTRALADPVAAQSALIYISCPPRAASLRRELRRIGAFLADIKLTYERTLGADEAFAANDPEIRACTLRVPDAPLLELAVESGLYSRYAVDPGFVRDEFRRLYHKWMEESLAGRIAYRTLILTAQAAAHATAPGPTLAMITLARKGSVGEIGLVAVSAAARGQGLGRRIVAAALGDFAAEGLRTARVKTQRVNRAARRLYVSAGFQLTEAECVYHYRPNRHS